MKINFETKIGSQKVMVNFEGSVNELVQASKLQRTELIKWMELIDDNKYNFERIINQYMNIGAALSKTMFDRQSEINAYWERISSKDEDLESVVKSIKDSAKPWDEL